MISEVVVVIADEQRKNKPAPQFAQIPPYVMAKLPNCIGYEGVCARIIGRKSQQRGGGYKWNTMHSLPVKSGNDSNTVFFNGDELVFSYANARLCRECQSENFASGNVTGIIRLWKLRQSYTAVRQCDGRFRTRSTERGARTEEKL
ncbi:hypothetical protein SDC9_184664 [bioreactor metagenome]|uniref:Uncharacterized protein n=1 Tax=bioreactor metagenome TaxID=1076179 RepID=A0A645HDN4_9ZZZZ